METINILNVTAIEPRLKHPRIFEEFDGLTPGAAFIINNDHDAPFVLYPNPVSDRLTIKLNIAPKSGGRLLITDLAGREMVKRNLSSQSPQETLDLSPLPAGTYIVKVLLAEQEFHSLIIKK